MNTLLLVNPISGTISKHRIIPHVLRKMRSKGLTVRIKTTEYPGHALDLAKEAAAEGYDALIVCGGDGTVNEAASGLVGTDTALGIIPAGSGNGLARHLGIPVDVSRSIDVIAERNIIDADYGTANDNPFFCTFGVGFDAAVSERFARQKRRGFMMYLKSAIDEYINFSPEEYIIEANGQVLTDKAFLVVVCNASQYGNNAYIAPDASVTDGELDITIVHADNAFEHARFGFDLMTGFVGKNAQIDTIRVRKATIRRAKEGVAHLDGDPKMMPGEINIECHPGKLKLLAPTAQTRFKPLLTPTVMFTRDLLISIGNIFPRWKR